MTTEERLDALRNDREDVTARLYAHQSHAEGLRVRKLDLSIQIASLEKRIRLDHDLEESSAIHFDEELARLTREFQQR